MLKIRETIIVEGKHDKIKLKSFLDASVVETNGFRVFKDKEKQLLIRKMAETNGIIILTDSDGGGQQLRRFLKGLLPGEKVKICFTPRIEGKEKRKEKASKAGFLGVEGLDEEVIVSALKRCGATFLDGAKTKVPGKTFTKQDLFDLGLYGKANSAELRKSVSKRLGIPEYLSSSAFLMSINCLSLTKEIIDMTDSV